MKREIDKNLVCPKCGSKMEFDETNDRYFCTKTFKCAYRIGYVEQTYGLNKKLDLGKAKGKGKVYIIVNTNNGTCMIYEETLLNKWEYGPYQICDLNIDVKSKAETV